MPVGYEDIVPLRGTADFSQQSLDAGAADVAQVINIPAKTTVLFVTVLPAKDGDGSLPAASTTVDVGHGTTVAQWGDGVSLAAAAYGTTVFLPYYFATADTIDLTATTDTADVDITAGKVEVIAYCIRHR